MKPSRLFYGFEAEPVADPQSLLPKEGLLSLIARTTIGYELPHITTILRDVGQAHRNRVADIMSGDVDVEGLATILGADLATVRALRCEDLGNGSVRYLGSTLAEGDVHTRERRFAPASLAREGMPFYRASWLVRTFPACPESWQILRSRCDCGSVQTWATVSSTVLCEGCGEDLRDLTAETVPVQQQPGLRLLADLLFGDEAQHSDAYGRLPERLRSLDGGQVFELALVVARIVDPTMGNPRENVWRDQPGRLARALSTAAGLLADWPDTPWQALATAGDIRIMHPRCEPLKVLQRVLSGEYASQLAAPLREDLDCIRAAIMLDGHAPPGHLVDLNDAERILGVNKWKIRSVRAAGHLDCHFAIRRGEILPAYDRAELEAIGATREWPSAYTVAARTGLPPYAVEQLCAMNDLIWAKAPVRTLRTGLRVQPASVRALQDALMDAASRLESIDPVPLTAVMRGIGGSEKAWGPVLRGLIEGRWPYSFAEKGRSVREIMVDRASVEAIRSVVFVPNAWMAFPYAAMLTQNDACDILNVPLRERASIERYKAGERRHAWLFGRAALSSLAGEIITSSELCARHLLAPKTAGAAMRRARLRPAKFGYERSGAEERFDAALSAV